MQVGLVTLFPEMFSALGEYGISSRAFRQGLVQCEFRNPRDFTEDRHRTVDDKPYGGGPGMLMKSEPLVAAIQSARKAVLSAVAGETGNSGSHRVRTIYLSPQGKPLTQAAVQAMANEAGLVLVCGRYQGIDARVLDAEIDEEWSLGDFVISGGEIAAMALLDAVIRLQPGALGDEDSASQDSFSDGLLHWPEYTRPGSIAGQEVPAVLLSGDHAAIRRWRLKQSLGMTWLKRPDLLAAKELDSEQLALLEEFRNEYKPVGNSDPADS